MVRQRPLAGWAAGGAVTQLLANGLGLPSEPGRSGVGWGCSGVRSRLPQSSECAACAALVRAGPASRDIFSVQSVRPLPWAGIPLYYGSNHAEAWALPACRAEDRGLRRCAGGGSGADQPPGTSLQGSRAAREIATGMMGRWADGVQRWRPSVASSWPGAYWSRQEWAGAWQSCASRA